MASQREIRRQTNSILSRIADYTRVERTVEDFYISPDYVAVEEELEITTHSELVVPDARASKIGRVLKAHPTNTDVTVGDRILFTEWEGGKWSFLDYNRKEGIVKCLIMGKNQVLARLD